MAENHSTAEWLLGSGGLITLGAAVRWLWSALWGRADKRQQELDMREAKLDAEEAKAVQDMRTRVAVVEQSMQSFAEQLEQHRLALHILVAKVARDDASAPELEQVANILGRAFPLHLHVPADMADALNRMDKGVIE